MASRGRHSRGRHLVEGRRSTRLKNLLSILLGVLIAAVLSVVAFPMAIDGEWRTVQTGSMEPHVSAGDVVLLKPSLETPAVGEVIAFPDPLQPERDVLHRVVAQDEQGFYITKGDANDVNDPWQISPAEVIGAQVLAVPRLGFLVEIVSSDVGILLFLVVPALMLLVSESRVWYRYVRYGSEAFDTPLRGRHIMPRGKHLAEAR